MNELVRYVQRLNAWRNPSVAEREEYPLYPLLWQEVSLTDLRQSPDTVKPAFPFSQRPTRLFSPQGHHLVMNQPR